MAKNLQSEFVKFYREKLEPFGFKKVKGRQPYFVRVVNDEILHIITYTGTQSMEYGYKAFRLMCGVATVYRKEINFSATPTNNSDWLVALAEINERKDSEYEILPGPRDLMIFYYNDENINEVLESTRNGVEILINELDKVTNMDDVLKYLLKYDASNITFDGALDDRLFDEEGLFYERKEFDYAKIDSIFENKISELEKSTRNNAEKEEEYQGLIEWNQELKINRMKFINNHDDYKLGMKLLKEHYNTNIDKLIGYGLDIKKRELDF